MTASRWDDRLAAATGVLLAACLGMVGFGFVLPSPGATTTARGFEPLAAPAKPVRLVVPSLRLKAPVLPIEVNTQQVLDPPADASQVGWWQRSARAGAEHGQTVLTGHTLHNGGGVMNDLGRLKRGRIVKVVTPRGTMVYRTTRVVTWTKDELAQRSADLFGQQREPNRLVLITCTDWTGGSYAGNIVAFAKPLGVRSERPAVEAAG